VDLSSYMQMVLASELSDWTSIERPVFLQAVIAAQGNEQRCLEIEDHHSLFTLKSNLSVSIALGLERSGSFSETWATEFTDRNARAYYADLCFCGRPIVRVLCISVDGGRALLPPPNPGGLQVPEDRKRLAKLIDGLEGGTDFDDYFKQAKLKTIHQPWP
jgi:hypothetical protein